MVCPKFVVTCGILLSSLLVVPDPRSARASAEVGTNDASAMLPYARLLAEFSNRRRANVYFENQQTLFYGVQANFVNVGRGNLTFVRRDLVTVGRLPILVARVYDSAGGTTDYGKGWRLSAAETLSIQHGIATLTDDTGSEIRFRATEDGFVLERDYPSDLLRLERSTKETIVARYRSGLAKEFSAIGSVYRLTRVIDRNGDRISFAYVNEKVSKISNGRHFVNCFRNPAGRIDAIKDDQGRLVKYHYNDFGQLFSAIDAGGNVWRYRYDDAGLLSRATDPDGRQNFGVVYGDGGKVRDLELPSGHFSYRYDEAGRVTLVTDRRNLVARYHQDRDGITVDVVNQMGDESAVGLDSRRNVESIKLNGLLLHTMEYNAKHEIVFRRSTTKSGEETAHYEYDQSSGELKRITYSDGTERLLAYDAAGNVLSVTESEESYTYKYSDTGDVIRFSTADLLVRLRTDDNGLIRHVASGHGEQDFEYSETGRLTGVLEAGVRASMKYDTLGLRQSLEFTDGRKSRYSYDSAANLRTTRSVNSARTVTGETLDIDADYAVRKVTPTDGTPRRFDYDGNGNLVSAEMPSGPYRFEYDGLGRLTAVVEPSGKRLEYHYAPGERSLVEQADRHSTVSMSMRWSMGGTFEDGLTVRALRTRASVYGSVSLSNGIFGLAGGSEIVFPDDSFRDAMGRLGLVPADHGYGGTASHFYAPANRMFLPAEYAFLNCCVCGDGAISPDLPCTYCPPPEKDGFTLSASQSIKDGQTSSFSLLVTGGNPTSYAWSFTSPTGAGNAPNVNFATPNARSTSTDGHWFALPNVACPTQSQIPAYYDATYTITASVTFDDNKNLKKSTSLTANSFWSPAGTTDPNVSDIAGLPTMAADNNGVWRVSGMGNLSRVVPTTSTIYVISTSQFYNKTVQHEKTHVNNWILGAGHLYGDLFIPADFYNQITNLTGTSQSDLLSKITNAKNGYFNTEIAIVGQRRNQDEHLAYVVSDPITPQYVYQNCGRYP